MNFAVYCDRVPTAQQAERIRALMSRTMKKAQKPFYSHTLCLTGPAKSEAMAVLSHGGCNVALRKPAFMCKRAIVIGRAPDSYYQQGRQVLVCPDD